MDGKIAVVISTEHRGVFFGYIDADTDLLAPETRRAIRAESVRMCVAWDKTNHGFNALAAWGPTHGARVTPAAPWQVLFDITSIVGASNRAVEAWESEPWN